MATAAVCRVIGGALVALVGALLAVGGVQLRRGGAREWPDVIADEPMVRRTSTAMIVTAALLVIAAIATIGNLRWGSWIATVGTVFVTIAAFPANYALFGNVRALHTGTNIVVAAIILALLWFGYVAQAE